MMPTPVDISHGLVPAVAPAGDIPDFIRAKVPVIPQQVEKADPNSNAYVNPWNNTVHVQNVAAFNAGTGTPQHEYEHAYEQKFTSPLKRLMSGEPSQDFGGVAGLAALRQKAKTIADMNVEQRAEMTGESYAAQKQAVNLAKQGKITPQQVQAFDQWKQTSHPFIQQLKNMGDAGIDTHPAAPGLPPAAVSGIVAPDPLLGGEWATVDISHGLKPQTRDAFMAIPDAKGLVEKGNLPIWNRPTVHNADGSHSSEYSTSFQDDKGREVLVPTVVNGKFLTPDGKKPPAGSAAEKQMFQAAWQYYLKTGQNLGKFKNADDADAYAEKLHNRGEQQKPRK